MLDFRYLTFLTLCQEKSYTATAAKLFITQPAVTQHIQWLEKQYYCSLILYHNRQVTLTPAGEQLYRFLIPLQAQIKKFEHLLTAEQPQTAPLRFATTLSISDYLLPLITDKLMTHYPQQPLTCLVENTSSIVAKLRAGHIDFALVEGNFPKEDFTYHELTRQPFIAVTSATSPLVSSATYSLKELLGYPLITRESGSGTRKILDHLLATQNYQAHDFAQLIELGSFPAIKHTIQTFQGLTFLYEAVVSAELASGTLKKIHVPDVATTHGFFFIYLKDSIFSASYQPILALLRPLFTKKAV